MAVFRHLPDRPVRICIADLRNTETCLPPITDDRAAWVSLPMLGMAYASRFPTHDFGYVLEMSRSEPLNESNATLWAGPWEITADSARRRGLVPVFVLLIAVALLKAVVWPNFRAGRRRRGSRSR